MSRLDGALERLARGLDHEADDADPLALLRDPPDDHERRFGLRLDNDWLRPARLLGVVCVAVAVVAGGVWLLRPPPAPVESTLPVASAAPAPPSITTAQPAELVVHVAGAVAAPGVYVLDADDRVHDAVQLAGGAAPSAELSRVNLAAPLSDGAYVYVPAEGETTLPVPAEGSATSEGRVSLNTASATELETLPGVGTVTAEAIIAHRELVGAFSTVDELLDVRGIGEAKLEAVRPLVDL